MNLHLLQPSHLFGAASYYFFQPLASKFYENKPKNYRGYFTYVLKTLGRIIQEIFCDFNLQPFFVDSFIILLASASEKHLGASFTMEF